MLRPVEGDGERGANASQVLEEPRVEYGKKREPRLYVYNTQDERYNTIQAQQKQIEFLERQIEGLKAGFENQIEDLKNNLGMVIASKDAMLAMKEEAIKGKEATLAAKDEIISIQSRRISELESHNEAEDLKKILGTSERIGQESTSFADIQPKDLSTKAKKSEYQP